MSKHIEELIEEAKIERDKLYKRFKKMNDTESFNAFKRVVETLQELKLAKEISKGA